MILFCLFQIWGQGGEFSAGGGVGGGGHCHGSHQRRPEETKCSQD